jgi:cation transport regulator ChaB
MIASPEEIREMLSTVREILREHRRMALYADVHASSLQNDRWGEKFAHDAAVNAVMAFDNMFKEPS